VSAFSCSNAGISLEEVRQRLQNTALPQKDAYTWAPFGTPEANVLAPVSFRGCSLISQEQAFLGTEFCDELLADRGGTLPGLPLLHDYLIWPYPAVSQFCAGYATFHQAKHGAGALLVSISSHNDGPAFLA
jgi:hypothetical protein